MSRPFKVTYLQSLVRYKCCCLRQSGLFLWSPRALSVCIICKVHCFLSKFTAFLPNDRSAKVTPSLFFWGGRYRIPGKVYIYCLSLRSIAKHVIPRGLKACMAMRAAGCGQRTARRDAHLHLKSVLRWLSPSHARLDISCSPALKRSPWPGPPPS